MQIQITNKNIKDNQKKEYMESKINSSYIDLIKKANLTEEDAYKNTIKLNDCLEELENCKCCKNIYECKNKVRGHIFYPVKKESRVQFSYIPCSFYKEAIKNESAKEYNSNVLKSSKIKDIKLTKNRTNVIKWIKNYYDNYDFYKTSKGLYLHGNFGTGKSFLVSALINELESKYKILTETVYFPKLLRVLKEDLSQVGEKISFLENVPILFLDDIGAEKVTEWGRDEILGTILQTRMNNGKPTFFTSNLTILELENYLSITKDKEDSVKAKRIIERIKFMTDDIELLGKNYREEQIEK